MHLIVYIRLDGFYCRILGTQDSPTPCLLHRDRVVIDANQAAAALGVVPGMGLAEAKVLVQGQGIVVWSEEPFQKAQADWLDVCAEWTDVIEPLDPDRAFLDLSAHADPRFLVERLQEELKSRLGWTTHVGMAGCRWMAELACRKGDPEGIALRTPRRFVAPFPTQELPIPIADACRLEFLGYRRIGDVAAIEMRTLRKQFDNLAFEIRRASLGGGDPIIRALYPPNSLSARFTYDGPPETMECFDAGLVWVAEDLGKRLRDGDLYGERLELYLEHEDGRITRLVRTFSKPFLCPKTALTCLRLMLEREQGGKGAREPGSQGAREQGNQGTREQGNQGAREQGNQGTREQGNKGSREQGVTAIRVRGMELRKADRKQMDFPITPPEPRGVSQAAVRAALRNVRNTFGETAVMPASQVTESRRVRVLRAWRNANGWA